MFKRFVSRAGSAAAIAALSVVISTSFASAQACTFTSFLNNPNDALASTESVTSFGTVCVTLTSSTTATITFSAATGYLIGGAQAIDAQIASANFSVTDITQSNGTLSIQNPPGSNNVDGQGSFNLILDNNDGFTSAFSTASFTVTSASGFTTADVLTTNNLGLDAAAHIFVCADPTCTDLKQGATLTGFAGENPEGGGGPGGDVPEPFSILLLGTVMASTGARLRKKFTDA